MTCLVTLFDRKLKVFKNSPKLTIFDQLLSTRNVNVALFARNVEYDFFCDFQTLCDLFLQHQIVIFICLSVGKWPMLRNAKE